METPGCSAESRACSNRAAVLFEISFRRSKLRIARCLEHAPALRATLSWLVQPEHWSERPIVRVVDRYDQVSG